MLLSRNIAERVDQLCLAPNVIFSELVRISNLDPERDFIHADLRGIDFEGSDLTKFNFERADLRTANWAGSFGEPSNFRFSMRGDGNDSVLATDFEELVELTLTAKKWARRFFAFATIVDNFGINYLTLDLLDEVVKGDKGEYMKTCAFSYYAASFLKISATMRECRQMAEYGNAYANMFKLPKLRKISAEARRFLENVERQSIGPGSVSARQIARIYNAWQLGPA